MKTFISCLIFSIAINNSSFGQCNPILGLEFDKALNDTIVFSSNNMTKDEVYVKVRLKIKLDSLCSIVIFNFENGNFGEEVERKVKGKYVPYSGCYGLSLYDEPQAGSKKILVSRDTLYRFTHFPPICATFEQGSYRVRYFFWYEDGGKIMRKYNGWFYYYIKSLK